MKDPMKDVVTKVKGATYEVPVYAINDEGVQDVGMFPIQFCKGSKSDPELPRQEGFFTESLLMASRQYLSDVNVGELRSNLTTQAVQRIDEAISMLRRRARDRAAAGVQNAMKPTPEASNNIQRKPIETEKPKADEADKGESNLAQKDVAAEIKSPAPEVEVPTAPGTSEIQSEKSPETEAKSSVSESGKATSHGEAKKKSDVEVQNTATEEAATEEDGSF